MEKRTCKYCGQKQDIDEFEIANVVRGVAYRRWKCNSCYIGRKSERRREIKKWLDDFKKTLKCNNCLCLDFHHRDNNKKFNIGDATKSGYSKETIKTEIDKCDVLCANCHRILHYGV